MDMTAAVKSIVVLEKYEGDGVIVSCCGHDGRDESDGVYDSDNLQDGAAEANRAGQKPRAGDTYIVFIAGIMCLSIRRAWLPFDTDDDVLRVTCGICGGRGRRRGRGKKDTKDGRMRWAGRDD